MHQRNSTWLRIDSLIKFWFNFHTIKDYHLRVVTTVIPTRLSNRESIYFCFKSCCVWSLQTTILASSVAGEPVYSIQLERVNPNCIMSLLLEIFTHETVHGQYVVYMTANGDMSSYHHIPNTILCTAKLPYGMMLRSNGALPSRASSVIRSASKIPLM